MLLNQFIKDIIPQLLIKVNNYFVTLCNLKNKKPDFFRVGFRKIRLYKLKLN